MNALRLSHTCFIGIGIQLLLLCAAGAQEIPRQSMARRKAQQLEPDYNVKIGQVLIKAEAKVSGEYDDNVYLSPNNAEGDFAVKPEFGLSAAWQVTQLNVLKLKTSIGFTKYLDHSELDSQMIKLAPDSALSFAFVIGDVRIEFHDQFTLDDETVADGAPGGVARLPRFTNTAGVSVLWDMNELVWTVGYDHYNLLTIGDAIGTDGQSAGDLSRLDHSTDQISASVRYLMNASTTIGLEGSAAYSTYPNQPSSDFASYSVGPTFDFQLTNYTAIGISAGFVAYQFDSGPPVLGIDEQGDLAVIPGPKPGLATGYYANLTFRHRLNRYYSDRFEVGHEDETDALSGRTESNYVRYSSSWNVNQSWTIGLGLHFQSVQISAEGGPNGTGQSDYTMWGCNVGTGYRLTEHANISLSYQFTQRDSDELNQNYIQNRFALGVGYQF